MTRVASLRAWHDRARSDALSGSGNFEFLQLRLCNWYRPPWLLHRPGVVTRVWGVCMPLEAAAWWDGILRLNPEVRPTHTSSCTSALMHLLGRCTSVQAHVCAIMSYGG